MLWTENASHQLKLHGPDFFVHHVQAKAVAGPLDLGDQVSDLLDALHLLAKELGLQVVAQVRVPMPVTGLVQVEQALVYLLILTVHFMLFWSF